MEARVGINLIKHSSVTGQFLYKRVVAGKVSDKCIVSVRGSKGKKYPWLDLTFIGHVYKVHMTK